MRFLVIVLALVGCGGDPAPKAPANHAAPAVACDTLDRNTCLASKQCTLAQVTGSQYECRPEVGKCERDLVQTDKAACEQRSGCRFEIATCYCACRGYGRTKVDDTTGPTCKCFCGGGKPSMCVAADSPKQSPEP